MTIYGLAFWRATFERALRTFLQVLVGFWIADDATGIISTSVGWPAQLSASGIAAGISIATSLIAGLSSPATGPSFGAEAPVTPAPPTARHAKGTQ